MVTPDTPLSGSRWRVWGGWVTLIGVGMFIATVIPLHFLQPGYEPADQLISELALGRYGWAMFFAFAGLSLATFGVQSALGAHGASWTLRGLLAAAAFFFLAAGFFPLGATSEIHIAAIAIAFVLSVLSMYLYPTGAGRAAVAAPRVLSWSLAAGVAASVALGHSVLPIGTGQRLAAICLLIWLATLGFRLTRQ
jgi:Protein of unknown function (DUF998)